MGDLEGSKDQRGQAQWMPSLEGTTGQQVDVGHVVRSSQVEGRLKYGHEASTGRQLVPRPEGTAVMLAEGALRSRKSAKALDQDLPNSINKAIACPAKQQLGFCKPRPETN